MTEEEFEKTSFRITGHVSYADEHISTYTSLDGRLGFIDHVPFRNDEPYGKAYRHWRINGKLYKSKANFLNALTDFNPEQKD